MAPGAAGFRATSIVFPGINITGAVAFALGPVMRRLERGPCSVGGRDAKRPARTMPGGRLPG